MRIRLPASDKFDEVVFKSTRGTLMLLLPAASLFAVTITSSTFTQCENFVTGQTLTNPNHCEVRVQVNPVSNRLVSADSRVLADSSGFDIYFFADALGMQGLGRATAQLSLEWSGYFVLEGGTGLATLDLNIPPGPAVNFAFLTVRVNGVSYNPRTPLPVDLVFGQPFLLSFSTGGSAIMANDGAGGAVQFSKSSVIIRQGGALVSGSSMQEVEVPEPATAAMAGSAIALLLAVQRRRRRRLLQ